MENSILMIGMGAIGGVSAAFIKQSGYNIEAVCKYDDYTNQVKTTGVHVIGVRGEHKVTMDAVSTVKELNKKYDIILLGLKAPDLMAMVNDIKPLIKENTLLVAMQNGIIETSGWKHSVRNMFAAVLLAGVEPCTLISVEMTSTGELSSESR